MYSDAPWVLSQKRCFVWHVHGRAVRKDVSCIYSKTLFMSTQREDVQ